MPSPTFKQAIFNRRMLICIFTGFSSGLPLFILYQLVPGWLRSEGVSLAEIGLFSLIGIPYVWKFIWSPLMDRYSLPVLGRRRSWMLLTQVLLLFSIAAFGFVDPVMNIWSVAYLAAAVAFFSASQDIVLDAYRRELLPEHELGLGNSIHVQAYRLAGLVPGSLAFILADHISWQSVFIIVASFMLVGIFLSLSIKELKNAPQAPKPYRMLLSYHLKTLSVGKALKPHCKYWHFYFSINSVIVWQPLCKPPFLLTLGLQKPK